MAKKAFPQLCHPGTSKNTAWTESQSWCMKSKSSTAICVHVVCKADEQMCNKGWFFLSGLMIIKDFPSSHLTTWQLWSGTLWAVYLENLLKIETINTDNKTRRTNERRRTNQWVNRRHPSWPNTEYAEETNSPHLLTGSHQMSNYNTD